MASIGTQLEEVHYMPLGEDFFLYYNHIQQNLENIKIKLFKTIAYLE